MFNTVVSWYIQWRYLLLYFYNAKYTTKVIHLTLSGLLHCCYSYTWVSEKILKNKGSKFALLSLGMSE